MKRTVFLFSLAAALGLVALALGLTPIIRVVRPEPSKPATTSLPSPASADGLIRMTAGLSDPVLHAGAARKVFLKVDLDARAVGEKPTRVPVNLALVLDRSGSMAGEKLERAKTAARALVGKLSSEDRLAIVTYGSDVTLTFSTSPVTAAAREAMVAAIDAIQDMGGTNLSGGLEVGVAQIRQNRSHYGVNRAILISDGQANEGVVEPRDLAALARKIADQDVKISTIGVGLDFNEEVMLAIADQGAGAYHYLRDADQLESIFVAEIHRATTAIATNVELTIAPAAGVRVDQVIAYAWENRGEVASVRVPDMSSGEKVKVVAKLTVPARHVGDLDVAQVGLRYLNIPAGRVAEAANVKLAVAVTPDERFALANRDKKILEESTVAEAGSLQTEASRHVARGDDRKAQALMQQAATMIRSRNAYVQSAELDAQEKMFADEERSLALPMAPAERQHKAKSFQYFGTASGR